MISKKIQKGETKSIPKTNIPKGFFITEAINSPFNNKTMALVVPQDGQEMPVVFLKKHMVCCELDFKQIEYSK